MPHVYPTSAGGTGGSNLFPGAWQVAQPVAPASNPSGGVAGASFQNGWGNVAFADGTYSPLRYRKNPKGDIELVGAISGGAFGSTCITLPVGFRPADDTYTVIASTDGTRALSVQITASTGNVVPLAGITAAAAGLVKIFDRLLSAPAATIDTGVNGIPTGYSGLWCYCLARRSDAVASATLDVLFNGDAGANYDQLVTDNSTGVMTPAWGKNQNAAKICEISGANMGAGIFAYATVWIPFYAETTAFKGLVSSGGFVSNVTDAELVESTSTWRNTAAINQLTFQATGANLVAGSHITIYGVP